MNAVIVFEERKPYNSDRVLGGVVLETHHTDCIGTTDRRKQQGGKTRGDPGEHHIDRTHTEVVR